MFERAWAGFVAIVLCVSFSWGALVQKSGAEYLQKYLSEGMEKGYGFLCRKIDPGHYGCTLKDYDENGENGTFAVKSIYLRFDSKSIEPILNEATFAAFLKNREISELIGREVSDKRFENGLHESIYRKSLEKRYLYDSRIEGEVSKRVLISLKSAEAEAVSIKDADRSSHFYAERIFYLNEMSESINGTSFEYPLIGKALLEFEGIDFFEESTGKDADRRALNMWSMLRSATPPSVSMIEMDRFVRFVKKFGSLNGRGVKGADARFLLENRPLGGESIVSILDINGREPNSSSSTMTLRVRLNNVEALFNDKSVSGMKPDFIFESLKGEVRLEHEYLNRYKDLLKSDPAFGEDAEAMSRYLSDLFRHYGDKSDNKSFKAFLKSAEKAIESGLKGRSKEYGFVLKNRENLTFSELIGGVLSAIYRKRDNGAAESIADFVFDNFTVELYTD